MDAVAPRVNLVAPTQVTVAGTIRATAQAADNVGVTQVSFFVDSLLVKQSFAEPHQLEYNAPDEPGTVVQIRAVARDATGNEGEDSASVMVVSTPDTTPPVIERVILPPHAAPGEQVTLRVEVTDDRGVAEVRFSHETTPIATDRTPPFEASVLIPADASVGTTFTIDVEAVDAAENTAAAQGSLIVAAQADTAPPSVVTVQAPGEALAGQEINLTASAVDDVGILKVEFFADGVHIAEDSEPPYEARFTVPAAQAVGSQLSFLARAFDFSGHHTDSSTASTRVVAPGEGFVVGEVYDDSRGLPLNGATVRVVVAQGGALGTPIVTTTNDRGRYEALLTEGDARFEIFADGYTPAYRSAHVEPGMVTTPLTRASPH